MVAAAGRGAGFPVLQLGACIVLLLSDGFGAALWRKFGTFLGGVGGVWGGKGLERRKPCWHGTGWHLGVSLSHFGSISAQSLSSLGVIDGCFG